MKRSTILAALAAAAAATFGATAVPAGAAVSSASVVGTTATLNLDGADDDVIVSVSAFGGVLVHNQSGGGLSGSTDWDSATDGEQTVPADGTFTIIVNGGDGNDSLTVLAHSDEVAAVGLDGGPGDDLLTGADSNDTLNGGEGNDRLVGAGGADLVNGGGGNDTLVWNNGDGSDTLNGDAGNDLTEVNGAPTTGDVFSVEPHAGRVKFQRSNLKAFALDASTERFQVNGLGGDDSLTAQDGVGALTLLSVDGGAGADTVNGSDGPDLLLGGEGNDVLSGGGGDDRIVGDRGNDTINGGTGDDTLVWNNGDNTDVMNGDAGRDDVEVNGAPAAGDVFTVQPDGARIKFDRPNLVPFSLDIGSSETLHANGLGGDDSTSVGDVGAFEVTGAGGAGNDTLTGGGSSETFLGGSGNDTITPGGGIDVVSGDDGDDIVNVRDNTADVALGGAGNDSVVADTADLDILDGFETVDRTTVATPPPVDNRAQPVTIRGGTVKVKKGIASIKVSCPAMSSGSCTGSLTLRTATAVKLAGLTAVLELGSKRYNIAPGASTTLKVKLAKGSRRLAGRTGRLLVRAIASTGAQGSIASSSQRLTLALGTTARRN
ncbi:MAG: calcium-binding protein [Actinobacteria bacterium]|nr:MAG: calcium-binding protein [Actinomycetota bacterium]